MNKAKIMSFIKTNTMIIALILITAFFVWQTGGKILLPQNVSNLISQNAYVFVLAWKHSFLQQKIYLSTLTLKEFDDAFLF
jgi:ABC-type xylose transport system permease subunit